MVMYVLRPVGALEVNTLSLPLMRIVKSGVEVRGTTDECPSKLWRLWRFYDCGGSPAAVTAELKLSYGLLRHDDNGNQR